MFDVPPHGHMSVASGRLCILLAVLAEFPRSAARGSWISPPRARERAGSSVKGKAVTHPLLVQPGQLPLVLRAAVSLL